MLILEFWLRRERERQEVSIILHLGHLSAVKTGGKHTQRGEEPPVLAARVALLQDLLDVLLGILPLADLLEGLAGNGTLQTLELEGVPRGHEVVVVDGLDEGLDLVALLLSRLGHAAGDLGGVSLDAGDEGVAVGVRLVAAVDGLDDDDLWVEEKDQLDTRVRY